MAALRKPRALPAGGSVGIVAPAGPVDPEQLAAGEAWLRDAGFSVVRRDDLLSRRGYLAGDDQRRAKEFLELVADDRVDAIICARGGYGCHRMVPLLDAARVQEAAKPLVGFSDATTLLLWQRRQAGLVSFHGPMLNRAADHPEDLERLVRVLMGDGDVPALDGRGCVAGRAEGALVGGSLAVLTASLGCPWEIDTEGAILMIEEVSEQPYRIDRMLEQLRAAGKLEALAGIGVGSLTCCDDPRYPSPTASEVVEELLRPLGVPLVVDLPFGHAGPNQVWPVGARAEIDGENGTIRVVESVVE